MARLERQVRRNILALAIDRVVMVNGEHKMVTQSNEVVRRVNTSPKTLS